mgnify:CR=1 FL=1
MLPDSRLSQRPDLGCQVVDWPLAGGGIVRIEAQPIYCGNCGVLYGWVPRENTTFAFWLCQQCFELYGNVVGCCAVPEDEFNKAVAYEMEERFGRGLTVGEIAVAKDLDRLGTALEKLERESPYPVLGG